MQKTLTSLYHSGVTYQEIGNRFGVSRQRVQQILSTQGLRRREIFNNKKQNPRSSEKLVKRKLEELGHKVQFSPYNYPFDLLVDGFYKVEVKHIKRIATGNKKWVQYRTMLYLHPHPFDYLVFVAGELKSPAFYIFACDQLEGKQYISVAKNPVNLSKHQKQNRGRWDLIPQIIVHSEAEVASGV